MKIDMFVQLLLTHLSTVFSFTLVTHLFVNFIFLTREHTTSWEINTLNCNKIYQQWFCKLFSCTLSLMILIFLLLLCRIKNNIMNNNLLFSSKVIGHFTPNQPQVFINITTGCLNGSWHFKTLMHSPINQHSAILPQNESMIYIKTFKTSWK